MSKYLNSIEKGRVRCIVFSEDDTWFGVALEFNLVIEAETSTAAFYELSQAIQGYVKSAKLAKIRPHVLNQKIDSEYIRLWNNLENSTFKKPSINPEKVSWYGFSKVAALA